MAVEELPEGLFRALSFEAKKDNSRDCSGDESDEEDGQCLVGAFAKRYQG